jgi:hypothetical protein
VNRSSAYQGNPHPGGLSREEPAARGPTNLQGSRVTIPDRAIVEAHLRTVRPECEKPGSPDDDAEVRIGRGLKYPKDKGYGTFLETLGYDRNWAGMLAARIVEEGRVRAATRPGASSAFPIPAIWPKNTPTTSARSPKRFGIGSFFPACGSGKRIRRARLN